MSRRFDVPREEVGRLQSGEELGEGAFLAYETHGALDEARGNAVLWVSCYSQRTADMAAFVGPGRRFDPEASGLFLVLVDMPGNGSSFSPCNPPGAAAWPRLGLTYNDNARLVRLLLRSLGVEELALIYGFSMGAMFAFEYCVAFPGAVRCAVATCGSAVCNPANKWFLQRLADALRADPAATVDPDTDRILGFAGGERSPPAMDEFAGIYADWILDAPRPEAEGAACPNAARPPFARSLHGAGRAFPEAAHGEASTAAWFAGFRERFRKWAALEYYEVSDTWRRGDCSLGFRGDLKSALGSIRAKMWILPGSTDQVRAPPGARSR